MTLRCFVTDLTERTKMRFDHQWEISQVYG
jgi:hypothetical protein